MILLGCIYAQKLFTPHRTMLYALTGIITWSLHWRAYREKS